MPALATLRITDGRQGKAEDPVVRSRALQFTAEEAQVAPNVVNNMYYFYHFVTAFVYAYDSYDCFQ